MPVTQVAGRDRLEPGRVYVIPPNRQTRGRRTSDLDDRRVRRAALAARADRSLLSFARRAAGRRLRRSCLSGAGSDGALGIKAVKEAGGIILVQDPDEAEFGSMPRNAIATGLADFVLPVRDIAARLPELIRNRGGRDRRPPNEADEEAVQRILSQLRARTGHDFSQLQEVAPSAAASFAACRCSAPRR